MRAILESSTLKVIAQLDNVRLVVASRTNVHALAEFTKRYGDSGYTDYHDLLADPAVDDVVIATPHDRHTQVVTAAADVGKHTLLEKPIAPTLAECDRNRKTTGCLLWKPRIAKRSSNIL